ncbi:hypothetical protein ACFLQW_04140 [Candidatus Zixiibacteriota bacterium]
MVVGLTGCEFNSPVGSTASFTTPTTLILVVDSGLENTVVDPLARSNPWNAGTPDSLTISSGKFLVRSLQFVNIDDYTVDTDISAWDEQQDENNSAIPFRGPYVMPVLGSASTNLGTRTVEVGDHNALSVVLHKGKETDDLGDDTDMIGRSVLVTGTVWYGGRSEAFVFDIDLRTEIIVTGDFTVPSSGLPEYVLKFNIGEWFRFGDQWLDPNKVENLSTIYRNVQRKIDGGRDYDCDGRIGD